MEIADLDDLADAELTAELRARAKAELERIAGECKKALAEEAIDTSLFFLIPNTGSSVLIVGTPDHPSAEEWGRISEIVSAITRQLVGVEQTRCRDVVCASTHDQLRSTEV